MRRLLFTLELVAAGSCLAAGLTSDPAVVYSQTDESPLWRTATNATFEVAWAFPDGSSSATLRVEGMDFLAEYPDLVGTSKVLELAEPVAPENENVYRLTLAFDNGVTNAAVIGVVRGHALEGTAVARVVRPTSSKWGVAAVQNALPVPFGATELTVDGESVGTGLDGAAGWCGWLPEERDVPYELTLTEGGRVRVVTLTAATPRGFLLLFK